MKYGAEEVRKLIDDLCPELKGKIAYRRNRKSGGMHVFIQHPPDTRFPKVRLHDERITLKKAGHGNAGSAKAPLVFETLGTDDGAKYCIVYAEGRENASETKITDIRTLTVSEMEKLEQVLERLAALLTPALSLSGHLNRSPLHFLEADQSQTGKGFFVRAAASIYGEQARLVTQRNGGVGSFDESLAARLAAGNPFISIDNLRGRLDSQYLEALLTAEGLFGVRIPYKGEIQIDSRPFCLFGTSNAVELTRDTANRMSIIRLRKQPEGYRFKKWKEGDLIEHIRANQGHLLGAVFSVLQMWIAGGKPRTDEPRHDFREWAQSLDWIVQHIFQAAPLIDGFLEAKERVTNNSLGFIRQLAVVIENTGQLRRPFSASELYSLCESHGIDVPNCKGDDDKAGQMQIGRILRQAFTGKERLVVDEYMIRRAVREVRRDDGKGNRSVKLYEFYKQSSALTPKK